MITTNKVNISTGSKKIIDLDVSTMPYDTVIDNIFALAKQKTPSYVCFANAHMAVEARLNPKLANSVNNATIVTSDGMSVVMAMKYLHKIKQDRTAGMDMIYDVMTGAEKNNLSVFLFGNSNETMDMFINKAKREHPNLKIAGAITPPFTEFTPEENQYFLDQINASKANMVFVSLGCPKQEKWMSENSSNINSVLLGFGGAFTLYSNKIKRAPMWMQQNCMEWLYRLIQEPRRLWKRYMLTNTLFVWYFFKQLLTSKRSK
ncbi:MAG: WecB/TagA/CpsF family glycosyltransferase [Cytophagales bacterium]|nr:WecB/TagA/CpsF family glycosyltransferase [Cytophagales bacterium]